jgi:tRNA modification GTPase
MGRAMSVAGGPSPIASVLTPPGPAGVAVISLRGGGADAVASAVFRPRGRKPVAESGVGEVRYGDLVEPVTGAVLDDAVACRLSADGWEFHCHGGAAVARAVLAALSAAGATVGEPAAPPTSILAEAMELLPRAATWPAAELLLNQDEHGLGRAVRDALTAIGGGDGTAASAALTGVLPLTVGRRLTEPASVAVVGKPNVGKSTLSNALFGRVRSLVSDVPGTTRDAVDDLADVGGFAVRLIDTAGRRDTADPIERLGVARAVRIAAEADLVVAVFDGSRPPDGDDAEVSAALSSRDPATVVRVSAKADLPRVAGLPADALPVSAKTGEGLDALRTAVLSRLGLGGLTPFSAVAFTERQSRLLSAVRDALRRGDGSAAADALRGLLGD